MRLRRAPRSALVRAGRAFSAAAREAGTEVDRLRYRRGAADLAVFHEFVDGPWGGGNQFLRALVGELRRRGLVVELNRISGGTPACLFNSFNFDFRRLRRMSRAGVRMVHRVDGPIAAYRGFDDGTDDRIAAVNRDLADATILQSRYSLDAHEALGFVLRDPTVVRNAVDPAIFHPSADARPPLVGRRVRVISTSWSDNPNKGADVLGWLDRNLDHERYELVFVGRSSESLANVRTLAALPSEGVAEELRRSDVYLAPSVNDPCSNSLLEALACGLPAVFRESGGHPELVGDAGAAFVEPVEVPAALERVVSRYAELQAAIVTPSIRDVADRYLSVLSRP